MIIYHIIWFFTIIYHMMLEYCIILNNTVHIILYNIIGIMIHYITTSTSIKQVWEKYDKVFFASLIMDIRVCIWSYLYEPFKDRIFFHHLNLHLTTQETYICFSIKSIKTKFCVWSYLYLHIQNYINCISLTRYNQLLLHWIISSKSKTQFELF